MGDWLYGPAEGRVRIRIDLAYDGSGFAGWARQPGLRSVQQVVEDALALVLREQVTVVVAGRTDAGVHASGQVLHVDVDAGTLERLADGHRSGACSAAESAAVTVSERGARLLLSRLRSALGRVADIAIHNVRVAPWGFDARFSPVWRRYEYRVSDQQESRNPLQRGFVLNWPRPVDVSLMHDAAQTLLGLHDWRAYCRPRDGATTVRELQRLDWRRDNEGVLVATVQADAFCHHMVRCLVGASLAVGEGRLEPDDLVAIRDRHDRGSAFTMVAGTGLVLAAVGYPPNDELAARAAQTRAKREPLSER